MVLFAYDLTALKRIEQELAQQKAHLASVVNAMPDMVFMKDTNGVYLSVNPVFERFAGRPESQVVGCSDFDLLAPAEAERFRKYDQRAMQAWQPLVYEETLTFAEDGYQGQFETIKTPIRDLHGRVTGILGVCRDITDRKRSEEEKKALNAQLQQAQKLEAIGNMLGKYPHAAISLESKPKVQKTYQLKAVCVYDDEYKVRMTQKMADDWGMPLCPCHKEPMQFE